MTTLGNLRRWRGLCLFGVLTVLLTALMATACAQKPGASSTNGAVTIGIGGQPLLVYLPTTLADRLGYYREEGLQVQLEDLQGGSKALQALQGGSVNVVSGFYDHTIQMQAKQREVVAFTGILQYPSLVLAVSPKSGKAINSVADLAGANVGVTAPGSSTDFFLKYLLVKNGLPADAATAQGIGGDASAVAAMESGKVDAAVMIDPAFSYLQQRAGAQNVKVLSDTRTSQGVQDVYGVSTFPASVLYTTRSWLDNNPEVARKLARAMTRTLQWIQQRSAQEIAQKMPPEYGSANAEIYASAIEQAKAAFSADGKIQPAGAEAVRKVMAQFNPEVAAAKIDLSRTYTNDYLPVNR